MHDTNSDFFRLRRWLASSVLAVCLLLAGLALVFVWGDYARSSREASNTLQAEALAFSEFATATMRAANVVLEATHADIQKRGGITALSRDDLYALLVQHLNVISADGKKVPAHSLLVVDAKGALLANSLNNPVVHRDLSDLEYYRHHRDDISTATWLSPLYVSRSSGLRIFVLSQRLNDREGNFQGVLAVTVRAVHFEDYFDQIGLSPDQTISLFRSDGKPLFRYPMIDSFEKMDLGQSADFREMRRRQRGSLTLVSPFDQQLRRAGYENGRQYPTLAVVTHLESRVLQDWRNHAFATAGFTLAALTALGLLLAFSLRQISIAEIASKERRKAISDLNATEAQLVQSEKLASLGRAVAVFSHDIGSPIGNGRVAITSLLERGAELRKALAEGSLRRTALDEQLAIVDEAAELIQGNLERAADLLNDFKLSAMDQATSQRRSVALPAWLNRLAHSLSPQFKDSRVRLEVNAEPGLILDTLPGPLSQVISNLVNNAQIHAFGDGDEGVIKIRAERADERILLHVEDNGKGMAPEVLQRVFEPFFTTRPESGGTGLGLHIVHSLVEESLGGRLSVTSEPGVGTHFIIEFPVSDLHTGDETLSQK